MLRDGRHQSPQLGAGAEAERILGRVIVKHIHNTEKKIVTGHLEASITQPLLFLNIKKGTELGIDLKYRKCHAKECIWFRTDKIRPRAVFMT